MTFSKAGVLVAAALMIGPPTYVAAQTAEAPSTQAPGTQAPDTQAPGTQNVSPKQGDLKLNELRELEEDNQTARWNNMTVDQLEDMDIVNADGDEIGEVEEVLADVDGNIVAITAEVGGFLGIGDKEVVVSLDEFELRDDELVTSLTKEQLEALPLWKDVRQVR